MNNEEERDIIVKHVEEKRKEIERQAEVECEHAKKQYKRDMMLQLVRNEALTQIIMQLLECNELHSVIGELADKLTEEAFK